MISKKSRALYIVLLIVVILTCACLFPPIKNCALRYIAWGLANYEWDKSGFATNPPVTKVQIDNTFHFAQCARQNSFHDLFVSNFFHKHGTNEVLRAGLPLGEYLPQDNHRFYSYRFLGLLPVDVVCDNEDKVLFIFPSFTH